jgi:hypothetical protein
MKDIPIYFIVANGRSGSTLLQTILDKHPKICAPVESRFVMHFYAKYKNKKNWTEADVKTFKKEVLWELKISNFWEFDHDLLDKNLSYCMGSSSYGELCKAVYLSRLSIFDKKEAKLIVDKNPIYSYMMPYLKKVFPYAKFIHLHRDYRGVVNSVLKLMPKASVKEICNRWLICNQEILSHLSEKDFSIAYEQLVEEPDKVMGKTCEFLGLSFESRMLEGSLDVEARLKAYVDRAPNQDIRDRRALGLKLVHNNIGREVKPGFSDKWKQSLTEKQISIAEEQCGSWALKQFEYELIAMQNESSNRPNFSAKLYKRKLKLYYNLPIWLRELKSKPKLVYLGD